ncbi:UPF0057-domain-containing protein [Podospora australis]|uniref:UPF0057-domain-containing protein n=1 Tax=Podospora australis TaxID=1536484 RepID=A0AAN6WN18_9PEZI|nr:UPF0057-domain-containing protein [Podospora australis]
MCSADIFLGLLAILFPPLPVWVKRGICSADSIINILLLLLGYIPGLIHAWYIIAKYPDLPYDYEYHQGAHRAEHGGNGQVYVFVHDGQGGTRRVLATPQNQQPKLQPPPGQNGNNNNNNLNYGSTASASNKGPSRPNFSSAASSSPQQQPQAGSSSQHEEGVAGGSSDTPPSYAQVVAGDHKIQTQE